MTREFKVGDKVDIIANNAGHNFDIGDTATLTEFTIGLFWRTSDGRYYDVYPSDIKHAEPVPVGYTGLLKDMDLKDGDKVRCADLPIRVVKGGTVKDKPINEWVINWTLVSRASDVPEWSNWKMSKADGTINTDMTEVEAVRLPDTKQVTYRERVTLSPKITYVQG